MNAKLSFHLGVIFPLAYAARETALDVHFQTQEVSSLPNIHQMVPFYQKLGFRLWKSTLFFHPTDKLQNQTPALATVRGRRASKNQSPVGVGRPLLVFIFKNREQNLKWPVCGGGRNMLQMCGAES